MKAKSKKPTTNRKDNPIENQVLYGLDSIDPALTVEVNLRQLLLVYKTVGELINFFHQPDHYPTVAQVQQYMGDRHQGIYALLSRIYNQEFKNLPRQASELLESDELASPVKQYYKSRSGGLED